MTDEEIAAMVLEAERLGPMTALEFQEQTDAIRAYARQAWQAGLESGSAGRLDMGELKHQGRMARAPGGG